VSILHSIHPSADPVIVRAIDAVEILPDERISRQINRGTLYRYTVKPIRNLLDAILPGHPAKVQEQQPMLARSNRPLQ
jgi:hypothetical protein